MGDDLFSNRNSERDVLFEIEHKIRLGLFSEALGDFDKLISINENYPLLYERLACVKFWCNREANIASKRKQKLELANMLMSYYQEFIVFAQKYDLPDNADIILAIRDYVFTNVVNMLESEYQKNADADVLRQLCGAFIKVKEYRKSINGLLYLKKLGFTDGGILSKLALAYYEIGEDNNSRLYLKEALFYDPLSIDDFFIKNNMPIQKSINMAKSRFRDANDDNFILLWAAVYVEIYNMLDISSSLTEQEVFSLRKMISRLEADCKKSSIKRNTVPRLFLCYIKLIISLLEDDNGKSNIDEIEFIVRKMSVLDDDITREFVRNLNI